MVTIMVENHGTSEMGEKIEKTQPGVTTSIAQPRSKDRTLPFTSSPRREDEKGAVGPGAGEVTNQTNRYSKEKIIDG